MNNRRIIRHSYYGEVENDNKAPLPGGLAPKVLYDDIRKLSVDPKIQEEVERLNYIRRIMENSDTLVSTLVIDRGFIGRAFNIGITPQSIIQSKFLKGYILINPTASAGLTTFATLLSSALRLAGASGNTQSVPIGVANFKNASLFLNISAQVLTPTIQIDVQTQDPLSGNWATSQSDIFGSPSAVGAYYANIGSLGIDRSFAIAFTVTGGTSSTFSLAIVLKDGLPGSSSGLNNTIYLGSAGVTSVSGFPLLEGNTEKFFLKPNAELFAVSDIVGGVTLKIIELQ